jgi:hypothetical protein
MAQKKKTPNKAKRSNPKKIKTSPLEKALRSLPPIADDFQKVLNSERRPS